MSAFVCSVLYALSLYLVLAMALEWVWVFCWIAFGIELDKICVQKFCCNPNEPFWIIYRIHCWPNIKCDYNRAKCIGFRVNKAWVYCLSGEEVNVWEIRTLWVREWERGKKCQTRRRLEIDWCCLCVHVERRAATKRFIQCASNWWRTDKSLT